ncbi:MAG: 2'-deoxycytidine 5'-triphosphate deaminase [Nitrospiraceae bacterium]|nr:MAG: 2'-deoxycytidine 5'-triphosphate deaminase [Nitrospiraceae bacterium]
MSKPAPKRKARNRNRGVLAYQQLHALVDEGVIAAKVPIEDGQFQPASLDLRLGDTAYRMLSSFLPEQSPVEQKLVVQDLFSSDMVMYELDLRKSAVLEKGHVYLIPLMEELALPRTLAAKTNPKSTTGRLDVFARTITDSYARFDEIRTGYRGRLYLEVVPRSFSIRLSAGMCLNQLRVVSGHPTVGDSELRTRHKTDPILYGDHAPLPGKDLALDEGLFLRINLKAEGGVVGFRAKKNSQVLDLSRIGYYDPTDFWEPIPQNRHETLLLEPEDFYILMSKERIRIPPEYAAEMVAYEAACGELRTHYAGFFDPGFGYGAGDLRGTPIVLEVRAHDVPFLIHDGQTFFKVLFERMHERPEKVYGQGMGSSYQFQGLTLSKHFKPYRG